MAAGAKSVWKGAKWLNSAIRSRKVPTGLVDDAARLTNQADDAARVADDLPLQLHHFATNKNQKYTPQMQEIADQFGLSLDDAWNTAMMPHLGRHPDLYHDFVLRSMREAASRADDAEAFIELFDQLVRQPVLNHPELLRSLGWQ